MTESNISDDWAHWTDDDETLEEARLLYKAALSGDEDALWKLVQWARKNAASDAVYDLGCSM